MDHPFLPLCDVRALTMDEAASRGGFQVRSLSTLVPKAPRMRPSMVRPCIPLEQLVAASAAFGRSFYGRRAPRQELRPYHRALENQLMHVRGRCLRPGIEHTHDFQRFLAAADALLRHLQRWVPEEAGENGPETLR